jgi:hypothetical protein
MRATVRNERLIGLPPGWARGARRWLTAVPAVLLLAGLWPAKATPALAAGTISLSGDPYRQDFDTLAHVAGSTANAVTIPGWDVSESGDGARDDGGYAVDTGASTTGDTYSYGSVDSTDRALGALGDDTLTPTIGASFTNATGSAITSVDIAYTGEQWHLGSADRIDRLDFQVSTSATSLTTGTWTDVDALDVATPSTGSPTGERDGNQATNRTSVSATVDGLEIPSGATFWIRWAAPDAAGADDGLAVDDFSLTPHADAAPAVAATAPADGASGVAPGGSISVTFGEPVLVAGGWFTVECATSGRHDATVSHGPITFVLDPATDFVAGEECTVTVLAAGVADQNSDDPPENPIADHVFAFTVQEPAPSEPPVANDDSASTHEDAPIRIPVTANDVDADGDLDADSVGVVQGPGHGRVVVVGGSIRYVPDEDFNGGDRFVYRVCDGGGRCDRATVTVTVDPVADRPVAGDVDVSTPEDGSVAVDVTGSVVDPDGDVVTVGIVRGPGHGRVVVVGGSIRYVPDEDFNGGDRFVYRVCDGGGRCDRATVTVTVDPVADRPVAGDVDVSTPEDGSVAVDVTGSVVDPDGDVVSVGIVRGPGHGRVVVVDGTATYVPEKDFNGRDRFVHRVCDASGRCDRATVRVTVTPVADRPVAGDADVSSPEDGSVAVDVIGTVVDPDGDLDVDSLAIVRGPGHGRAVVVGGSIRYVPDEDFNGGDRFVYRICDASGRCDRATVTVTVTPVADRPVAGDVDVSTPEDGSLAVDVIGNVVDPDGDLDVDSLAIVRGPGHGRVVVVGGLIRYVPDENFNGGDRFVYRICDASGRCDRARVTVTVTRVADVPVARPDVVIVVRVGQISIDVLGNDTDADGRADLDETSVTIVDGPSLGTAVVDATNGTIEYTAAPGTDGTDELTYRVCDLGGRCATATLVIRVDVPSTSTTTTPPPPGTLPQTGSNLGAPATAAALAALGAGVSLLVASRRMNLFRRRVRER